MSFLLSPFTFFQEYALILLARVDFQAPDRRHGRLRMRLRSRWPGRRHAELEIDEWWIDLGIDKPEL